MWNTHSSVKELLQKQYKINTYSCGTDINTLNKYLTKNIFNDESKSVSRRKAEAIAYLMRHAEIDICPDEFFADKINHNGLSNMLMDENRVKVYESINKSHNNIVSESRIIKSFSANMDFGHVAPDWQFIMDNGIPGILSSLKENRENHINDSKKTAFYDECILVYEAFIDLLLRIADYAENLNTEKMHFLSENLKQLSKTEPKTLAQAMELTLLFYNIQYAFDGVTIRSLGGIDRLYCKFYKTDLESGNFSEENIRELTRDFLWKINAMEITANTPFYICGLDADGNDATNEYTQVLLEEYDHLDIYDPKMHVMYHENINKDILNQILEMIRKGNSSFVFVNVPIASKALEKLGISSEDAKKVIVYGCYETAAEGTEIPCTCAGMINLAKAVELALYDGVDPKSGIEHGPKTGKTFKTFDEFYNAVKIQLKFITESCIDIITDYERQYDIICHAPLMSATYKHSRENGIDLYDGGAKYNNTSIVGAGIATLVDSILAVKKAVFDDDKISFGELKNCLKANWEGYADLRNYCIKSVNKYGNNKSDVDNIAVDIFNFFADLINNKKNGRGGVFRCGLFSVDWRMWMGAATGATPDGRHDGEPLSKNAVSSIGQDNEGVTALINTILKLDSTNAPDGIVADIVLHSSAVSGDDGLDAFNGLLNAYMTSGGFAIHFNVLNREVLLKAQAEPEKYKNLQIRLCGWNVYFVNLSKEEQDEFILQSSRR